MIERFASGRISPWIAIPSALAVVACVGVVDYLSGQLAMSLLYFIPIIAVAWFTGELATSIVATASGASWLVAELHVANYAASISYWNGFTRYSTFLALGLIVALVRRDRDRLGDLNAKLEIALERETALARTDPLTSLPNSRAFRESLTRELARCQRQHSCVGVAYVDLDNFKKINDRYGHGSGDDVLRRVGEALRDSMRSEDLAARVGGDEFALVLVGPSGDGFEAVGGRIIERMQAIASDFPGCGFGATIGFVRFEEPPGSADEVIRAADQVMYDVKARSKGTYAIVER